MVMVLVLMVVVPGEGEWGLVEEIINQGTIKTTDLITEKILEYFKDSLADYLAEVEDTVKDTVMMDTEICVVEEVKEEKDVEGGK